MKYGITLLFTAMVLLLSACQSSTPACPPDTMIHVTALTPFPTLTSPTTGSVEINGQVMLIDQVVHGALCDGNWNGTVYVACDVQVAEWEDDPTFLKDCNLSIESGAIVYVAAHNDTPYYKGCSCHTGEDIPE